MGSLTRDLEDLVRKWVAKGEKYWVIIEAMQREIDYIRNTPRAYAEEERKPQG